MATRRNNSGQLVNDLQSVSPSNAIDNWGENVPSLERVKYPAGERAWRSPVSPCLSCWTALKVMRKNIVSTMLFGCLITTVGMGTFGALVPALLCGLNEFLTNLENDDEQTGAIDDLWSFLKPLNKKLTKLGLSLFIIQILFYTVLFPFGGFYFAAVFMYASFIFCHDDQEDDPRSLKELFSNSKDIVAKQSTTMSHVTLVLLQHCVAFAPPFFILWLGFFLTDFFVALYLVWVAIPFLYISSWYAFHEVVLRGDCTIPDKFVRVATPSTESDHRPVITPTGSEDGDDAPNRFRYR